MVSGRKTGEPSAVGSPRYDAHAMTASTTPTDTPSSEVLQAFGLAAGTLEATSSGLINRSWYVRSTAGEALVLQRVNPLFAPDTNADIDVVTRHLRVRGLLTPTLVPTLAGSLWFESGGAVWRVLTRIDGVIHDSTESPARAAEAGAASSGSSTPLSATSSTVSRTLAWAFTTRNVIWRISARP